MKVIIAEKPSLARNIVEGIGGTMKKNMGYFEGQGYFVTWAFGHLFSLCDIESYQEHPSQKWQLEGLPCFPKEFQFELKKSDTKDKNGNRGVDAGVERQFHLIENLVNRADVDGIIHAGDADREGEVIVRLCIQKALKSDKPIYRLWLPDQTPQTVASALADLKEDKEYDSLADEGFARTYIDWLYGTNLTRLASLKTGTLLRVGRVIVPIVHAIYDRDLAIRNFTPEKYFAMVSHEKTNGEVVELTSKKKFSQVEKANGIEACNEYNQAGATVKYVKSKEDVLFAGKLYSLSKLQNVLSKKYKMSMKVSLDLVQNLYEKGFLTYPRTNSEYLATAEMDKMRQIIAGCSKLGYPVKFKNSKYIFDDSKIESHSALTPTYKIPQKSQLTEDEYNVYSTVFRRFVAVFCSEDCIVSKTEIGIDVGNLESFVLKGTVVLEKGWTKYDDYTQKDKILPALKEGENVNIQFQLVEKETTPPKHYTVETLNNFLKNPFKNDKKELEDGEAPNVDMVGEDDTEEYRAILDGLELGTEATRTGIIDNAKRSHYIDLKKDVYYILPGGEFLIQSLENMNIVMNKYKTSQLGQALKRVFHGTMTIDDTVRLAEMEIENMFNGVKAVGKEQETTGFFGDVVGKCPICGKEVKRNTYAYTCEDYSNKQCTFSVSTSICKKDITVDIIQKILSEGKSDYIPTFVSPKSGKMFGAYLVWHADKKKVEFEFMPRQNDNYPKESHSDDAPEPTPPEE